jgi:hypothetical protein
MKMEQCVPKRRHIKFRRRGITQKKTYMFKKTAILERRVHIATRTTCLYRSIPLSDVVTVVTNGKEMEHLQVLTFGKQLPYTSHNIRSV